MSSPAVSEAPTVRRFARAGLGLSALEWAILAVVAIWAFAPLVLGTLWVSRHGGVITGVNGADFFDQFQYLAWIRDEGDHLFASNLWVIGSTPHDYVHPMYLISGILWRLGASLQLAYLIWKPVAVLVLFGGCVAYARRWLPDRPRAQAAAVLLAIFYQTPIVALAQWTHHLSGVHRYQLLLATDDAYSALQLWGFEHTAIAIGLLPVFLLAAERVLRSAREGPISRRALALCAASGLLEAWLHPWQGGMLLLILGGVFFLAPSRRRLQALLIPGIATLLPLIYSLILSRTDASWRAFGQASQGTGTAPWWALIASFGPLAAFGLFALRRPRDDGEWMLLLWIPACAIVYFVLPQFPPHALAGLPVPLAILAVQGWARLRQRVPVRGIVAAALAVLAVALTTVIPAINHSEGVHDGLSATVAGSFSQQQMRLTAGQAAALRYLDSAPGPGGVLAPWLLSLSIPGFTGRPVFVGHLQWEPGSRLPQATAFFSRTAGPAAAKLRRAILASSGARFVLADCDAPPTLTQDIAPLARPVRRFGCVTVYARS